CNKSDRSASTSADAGSRHRTHGTATAAFTRARTTMSLPERDKRPVRRPDLLRPACGLTSVSPKAPIIQLSGSSTSTSIPSRWMSAALKVISAAIADRVYPTVAQHLRKSLRRTPLAALAIYALLLVANLAVMPAERL